MTGKGRVISGIGKRESDGVPSQVVASPPIIIEEDVIVVVRFFMLELALARKSLMLLLPPLVPGIFFASWSATSPPGFLYQLLSKTTNTDSS